MPTRNQNRGRATLVAALAGIGSLVFAACGGSSSPSPTPPVTAPLAGDEAVVIVSGLATQTPFTTTQDACAAGLSAGNTASALRDSLVSGGSQVFTAPAQNGPGTIETTQGLGASSQCPPPLPASMTIDTTAGIDRGGRRLAAYIAYLHEEFAVSRVHLVGHSMGGLFARAAIGRIPAEVPGVTVLSLTTLSTPWTGTYPADYASGALPLAACGDDATCRQVLTDYKSKLADVEGPRGAANVITTRRLQGTDGWNVRQGDDLADVPVTLIAGDHFQLPGGPVRVWPNDAVVARDSALARGVAGTRPQVRACLVRPDVHTIALAEQLGLPWTAAVTWDPEVLAAVAQAVGPDAAGSGDTEACRP